MKFRVVRIIFVGVFTLTSNLFAQHPSAHWQPHQVDSLFKTLDQQSYFNPDTTIQLAFALLTYSTAKKNKVYQGKSNHFLGKAYNQAGDVKKALHYLQAGLLLFQSCFNRTYECLSLKEIGNVYYNQMETDQALNYYSRALVLAKEVAIPTEVNALTNNIGNLFFQQGRYDEAIKYYQEGLASHPGQEVKATLLANISKALARAGKLDEALTYGKESETISRTLRDSSYLISSLNAINLIYSEQEKDQEVLTTSLALLPVLDKMGLKDEKIETLNRIGLSHLYLGNPKKSVRYFNDAIRLGKEINYPQSHYIYANLAFAHEALGNFKQAYEQFKIHKQLQDSLNNVQSSKKIEELLAKYEADKKERQITLLKQEKQLQDLKLQQQHAALDRQTLIRNTVIFAAFALLIPALTLLIFYKQKMRSKVLLAAKSEEVNRQRILELIHEHEIKTIKANLEGREKERERIAQELHDSVAGSLAGIKLHLSKVAEQHNQEVILKKAIRNIDALYQEVRTISHNLSPARILNTAFIDLLKNQLQQMAENSTFEVDFICYPEDQLNQLPDSIKIEVYRIIQELMTNIIRHANATAVDVQFTQTDESINLIIEDTGKGFDSTQSSFGLGLNNIKTRVNSMAGQLHIESMPGRGTIVTIDIPYRIKGRVQRHNVS